MKNDFVENLRDSADVKGKLEVEFIERWSWGAPGDGLVVDLQGALLVDATHPDSVPLVQSDRVCRSELIHQIRSLQD